MHVFNTTQRPQKMCATATPRTRNSVTYTRFYIKFRAWHSHFYRRATVASPLFLGGKTAAQDRQTHTHKHWFLWDKYNNWRSMQRCFVRFTSPIRLYPSDEQSFWSFCLLGVLQELHIGRVLWPIWAVENHKWRMLHKLVIGKVLLFGLYKMKCFYCQKCSRMWLMLGF